MVERREAIRTESSSSLRMGHFMPLRKVTSSHYQGPVVSALPKLLMAPASSLITHTPPKTLRDFRLLHSRVDTNCLAVLVNGMGPKNSFSLLPYTYNNDRHTNFFYLSGYNFSIYIQSYGSKQNTSTLLHQQMALVLFNYSEVC